MYDKVRKIDEAEARSYEKAMARLEAAAGLSAESRQKYAKPISVIREKVRRGWLAYLSWRITGGQGHLWRTDALMLVPWMNMMADGQKKAMAGRRKEAEQVIKDLYRIYYRLTGGREPWRNGGHERPSERNA